MQSEVNLNPRIGISRDRARSSCSGDALICARLDLVMGSGSAGWLATAAVTLGSAMQAKT